MTDIRCWLMLQLVLHGFLHVFFPFGNWGFFKVWDKLSQSGRNIMKTSSLGSCLKTLPRLRGIWYRFPTQWKESWNHIVTWEYVIGDTLLRKIQGENSSPSNHSKPGRFEDWKEGRICIYTQKYIHYKVNATANINIHSFQVTSLIPLRH